MLAILGIAILAAAVLGQNADPINGEENLPAAVTQGTSLPRCTGDIPVASTITAYVISTTIDLIGQSAAPETCAEETVTPSPGSCVIVKPPIVTETVISKVAANCASPLLGQCESGCTNLCSDPKNCGKCGNKCPNTECINGVCVSPACITGAPFGCAFRCECSNSTESTFEDKTQVFCVPFNIFGPPSCNSRCVRDTDCPLGNICSKGDSSQFCWGADEGPSWVVGFCKFPCVEEPFDGSVSAELED